jgi:hypothetical protein
MILPYSTRFPTQTASHERLSSSRSTGGTTGHTWSTIAAEFECRIEDASAATIERFEQKGMTVTHTIYTTYAVVEFADRLGIEGAKYVVHGVTENTGFKRIPTFYQIDCEEIVTA